MKYKKSITISVVVIVVFSLIIGAIYFYTHYAIIDNTIYKTDINQLCVYSLSNLEIKEINKCNNIKILSISDVSKNQVSKFNSLSNLEILYLTDATLCSEDTKNLNTFTKLNKLYVSLDTTINLNGLSNKSIELITLYKSNAENLKSLVDCESLKSLEIYKSTISGNCIVKENGNYILKDSSCFVSLNNLTFLAISVDEIQDISGILEMDSLETFCVNKDSISEEDVKSLENKGITVTYCD